MDIPVIYEDSDVVVVNKPPRLVVHADGRTSEPTLTDWVLRAYPETANVGEPLHIGRGSDSPRRTSSVVERPGIVHRLDRETSGALVVAKNQNAFNHLKKQFQDRTVEKTYHAFVYGSFREDGGVIDRPIGKSAKDFRLRSAQRGSRGALREAVTEYHVEKRGKDEKENPISYVRVQPKTGRTHQIRAHFKAIHHPLVCDALYAPKQPCVLGFTRLALHASSLSFTVLSGQLVTAEAPFPEDFIRALSLIAKNGTT